MPVAQVRSTSSTLPSSPAGLNSSPFFIVGCPRSGTSLLSTMLGTHPRLAIPYESHLYDSIYPIVRRYGEPRSQAGRRRLISEILRTEHIRRWQPAPSVADTVEAIERPDFHGIVEGMMRAWSRGQGKPRWGEKTPQHALCWRAISARFPDLQIIHVVRDGRDVALSYRTAFFGPKHVYALARRWSQYLASAEEARAFLGESAFLQVRYEALLNDPEKELRRICAFLCEEFTPSMLEFYRDRRPYHSDQRNAQNLRQPVLSRNSGKWTTGMSGREVRIFEALAGAELERHGYDRALPGASVSRWEALSCRYLEHPPRRLSAMLRNRQGRTLAAEKVRLHVNLLAERLRSSH